MKETADDRAREVAHDHDEDAGEGDEDDLCP